MHAPHLDHLALFIMQVHPRRAFTRALATLPLAGAAAILLDDAGDAEARRRQQRHAAHAHAEKKKKKKKPAPYCLNDQTVGATKKNRKKLVQQGAIPGACAATPPPPCIPAWTAQTTLGSTGSGASEFKAPWGLALAADALTLWVTDASNNRIVVWTRANASAAWAQATTFGSAGSGVTQLSHPQGVAVSSDGRTAWVADSSNSRISIWTRPTASSTAWSHQVNFGSSGNGDAQFLGTLDVTVSADERTAWVADGNLRISVWTRPTVSSTVWTHQVNFGAPLFQGALSVTVSADGLTILAADTFGGRVMVWARSNLTSTTWFNQTNFGSNGSALNQFAAPYKVALSPDTRTVCVTNAGDGRVSIWSRPSATSNAWSPVTTFSSQGAFPDQLLEPHGIAASSDGQTVWIADSKNDRISIWENICPA